MARDYVVYLRLNVKQGLRLLYSCVPYRINLDMKIFLKKNFIESQPKPASPQTGATKTRESPTNLGLNELPITDQIPSKAPHIPGWGFTSNGA